MKKRKQKRLGRDSTLRGKRGTFPITLTYPLSSAGSSRLAHSLNKKFTTSLQALEAAGLVVSGIVQMDGQWHKTTVSTSRNTKALKGAYRCEIVDGAARGFIANHDTGERRPWFPEGTMLSSKVLEHHRQLLNENRRQREQNEHTTHEDVAVHIGKKWETLAPDDHPYLKRKQVE